MNTQKIRIIAADDHELLLDGVSAVIANQPDIELIGKAKSGTELVSMAKALNPDIVITDLRMPGMSGIEAVKEISIMQPAPGAIILSMFDDDFTVIAAAKAGVLGYVTKGTSSAELVAAIHAVSKKQPYYCPTAGGKLVNYFNPKQLTDAAIGQADELTDEEKEIIRMMADGKTTNQIAKSLFKSRAYVNDARIKIRAKVGGSHLADIVRWAIKNGLID